MGYLYYDTQIKNGFWRIWTCRFLALPVAYRVAILSMQKKFIFGSYSKFLSYEVIFQIIFLIIIVLGLGCTSTEKIGNVTYKTKINKVFIDDYNGMVLSIKLYYFKNEFQAGCTIKGQKLGFENLSDTVFIYGTTTIDSEQKNLFVKNFTPMGIKLL